MRGVFTLRYKNTRHICFNLKRKKNCKKYKMLLQYCIITKNIVYYVLERIFIAAHSLHFEVNEADCQDGQSHVRGQCEHAIITDDD